MKKIRRYKIYEDITEESILEWQALGAEEILAATWQLSLLSYELRGEKVFPIDRSKIKKMKVPWNEFKS